MPFKIFHKYILYEPQSKCSVKFCNEPQVVLLSSKNKYFQSSPKCFHALEVRLVAHQKSAIGKNLEIFVIQGKVLKFVVMVFTHSYALVEYY